MFHKNLPNGGFFALAQVAQFATMSGMRKVLYALFIITKNISMENEVHHDADTSANDAKDTGIKHQAIISTRSALVLSGIIVLLALIFVYKSFFVAAVVNGSPISRYAVVAEAEKRAGKATLDTMIIQKILANEVSKNGITVSADEINAELVLVEGRFAAQGTTLDAMLLSQGMTRDDVTKQIITQLQVQKLLGDKIAVTDAEINQFITTNKVTVPEEKEAELRTQVAAQIKQEKTNKEGSALVESLRSSAKVTLYVQY